MQLLICRADHETPAQISRRRFLPVLSSASRTIMSRMAFAFYGPRRADIVMS